MILVVTGILGGIQIQYINQSLHGTPGGLSPCSVSWDHCFRKATGKAKFVNHGEVWRTWWNFPMIFFKISWWVGGLSISSRVQHKQEPDTGAFFFKRDCSQQTRISHFLSLAILCTSGLTPAPFPSTLRNKNMEARSTQDVCLCKSYSPKNLKDLQRSFGLVLFLDFFFTVT